MCLVVFRVVSITGDRLLSGRRDIHPEGLSPHPLQQTENTHS